MSGNEKAVRYYSPGADLGFLKKNEVYGAWFLDALFRQRIGRKVGVDGWVPLRAEYLRRVMPWRGYKAIIGGLIDAGVVECDNSYRPGERSKSYRLGSRYREAVHKLTSYRVSGRIARKLSKPTRVLPADMPYLETLRMFLTRLKPRTGVEEYLDSLPEETRVAYRLPLHDLGQPEIVLDDFGRRCHSPITRMKKKLRQYLTFDGEEIVEVDVKNFQPLLLCLLRLEAHKHGDGYHFDSPCLRSSPTNILHHPPPYVVTIPGSDGSNLDGTPRTAGRDIEADWADFISLCLAGEAYKAVGRVTRVGTRRAKKRMFKLMFQRPDRVWKFKSRFGERFPSVLRFLGWLKEHDHRHAARFLQRAESGLIIHDFARKYVSQYPDAPIATIHDAILVPKSHRDRAIGLLQECARAMHGVELPLKVKLLAPAEVAARPAEPVTDEGPVVAA